MKSDGFQSASSLQIAKEFLRNPLKTGAVAPSSPTLVKAMTRQIDFKRANSIVELGPGTGVITEAIVEQLQSSTHFFALELNAEFAEITRQRCPNTLVEVGCATTLGARLQTLGLDECDFVISALPWTLFDSETQEALVEAIAKSLSADGKFIFYTYRGTHFMPSAVRFRQVLGKYFSSSQRVATAWKNLPPAGVYVCSR